MIRESHRIYFGGFFDGKCLPISFQEQMENHITSKGGFQGLRGETVGKVIEEDGK